MGREGGEGGAFLVLLVSWWADVRWQSSFVVWIFTLSADFMPAFYPSQSLFVKCWQYLDFYIPPLL